MGWGLPSAHVVGAARDSNFKRSRFNRGLRWKAEPGLRIYAYRRKVRYAKVGAHAARSLGPKFRRCLLGRGRAFAADGATQAAMGAARIGIATRYN